MHADELKKLLKATPFKPFTVDMPSEKAFQIPHSDFAFITPNGRTLIVAYGGGGVDLLDIPLITRVEIQQATASAV
jgi:hypothetical protein